MPTSSLPYFVDDHQLLSLLSEPGTLWIDVRAPIEFKAGAVPGAINLPLLNDEERHQIGIVYKNQGPEAAMALGYRRVSGDNKSFKMQQWLQHIEGKSKVVIYCFRGGQRSQIVQSWLAQAGVLCPIVPGGYKNLRQKLLFALEELVLKKDFVVVSGPTGSGKTEFLHRSGKPFIDLEELANHRGSAFGARSTPQPSQGQFENTLACALLRYEKLSEPLLIENESRMIGQICLPERLYRKMATSPKHLLQVSFHERVENIYQNYIVESIINKNNLDYFSDLEESLGRLRSKLGGARTTELLQDLTHAKNLYLQNQDLSAHRLWIAKLLEWYYDPLYSRNFKRP